MPDYCRSSLYGSSDTGEYDMLMSTQNIKCNENPYYDPQAYFKYNNSFFENSDVYRPKDKFSLECPNKRNVTATQKIYTGNDNKKYQMKCEYNPKPNKSKLPVWVWIVIGILCASLLGMGIYCTRKTKKTKLAIM